MWFVFFNFNLSFAIAWGYNFPPKSTKNLDHPGLKKPIGSLALKVEKGLRPGELQTELIRKYKLLKCFDLKLFFIYSYS